MATVKQTCIIVLEISQEFARRTHALLLDGVIILYGSAARGDMEEFSDIDIYIEVPDDTDIDLIRPQINDIAWEIGLGNNKIIQIIVYRKSDVWNTPWRSSPFIKSIHSQGIAL